MNSRERVLKTLNREKADRVPIDLGSTGAQHPDIDEYEPEVISDEDLEYLRQRSIELYNNTDKAIIGGFYPGELFFGFGLGGFEDWMCTLLTKREYVKALFDKTVEAWLSNIKLYKEAVDNRIAAVVFTDDFGTQKGEFLSKELFIGLIKPYYKRIFDWIHSNTNWKIFFHSCGSIYNFILDMIEMGVDILNPIQCSAANMEPQKLKDEFGDRIIFWGGGVDTQHVLPFTPLQKVKEQVKERLKIFGKDGGYVFGAIHNIQHGTPAENIIAMFDTAIEYGQY